MLRQDDFLKGQIVLTAWRYGKEYGGHLASILVMQTLMNRIRLGWGSHLDVIERIPMYAAENEQPIGYPLIWDANFVRLLHEVDSTFDGSAVDLSKGALYWCDLRKVEREWFKEKIIGRPEEHPRVADLNSLTFFR